MPADSVLKLIRDEHAALTAVLSTMSMLVRDARRRGGNPDFHVLRAMLFYIDEFPERLHHVKETTMLFPRLRERTHEADAVISRLDHDHHGGAARVRNLAQLLTAWEFLGESRREAFERALDGYAAFYLEHMRVEEMEVLPLAQRCLDDADWRVLERAFGTHRDALTGSDPQAPYAELFRTIVRITPAPYGVGDAVT